MLFFRNISASKVQFADLPLMYGKLNLQKILHETLRLQMVTRPSFVSARCPLGIFRPHSVQKERHSEKRRFLASPITCSVGLSRRSRHKIHRYSNGTNGRGLSRT